LILAPASDEKGSKGSWLAANAEVTVCSRRDVYCQDTHYIGVGCSGFVDSPDERIDPEDLREVERLNRHAIGPSMRVWS
jgi:hypothetical protein